MQIKQWIRGVLPPTWHQWLWTRKIAFGNRRILEIENHLLRQLQEKAQQDISLFERISTKTEWEVFRHERISALRHSLAGTLPQSDTPEAVITGTLERDQYRIDNVVFQGHMNLPVTANLYVPNQTAKKIPAMVICHSHHDPKTEEELQSMGMTWAQQGCMVLIMDLLGHGERRQHPFVTPTDYSNSFRVDRQDYYFRHVLGMQLNLIGESLMGWMVQDVRRGIDLLLADSQIDHDRIIVIGAVAGGGDVAAIIGALDNRVAAVVAFNFGQFSMGGWDSARSLPDTARSGYWPWVILASLAPRRLVYGREFAWDPQHDVTWKHLRKVYELYGQREALHSVHGSGRGSRQGPLDSHCTNVGPLHRSQLYPILENWFGIPIPEQELIKPLQNTKLKCLTMEARKTFGMRMVHEVAQEICKKQLTPVRRMRASQEPLVRAVQLQQELIEVLGPMAPYPSHRVKSTRRGLGKSEYVVLEVEENICVRLQILWPSDLGKTMPPVVIGCTQEGNQRLRKERSSLIQSLLNQKIAVCLAELRGIGDGRQGEVYRGRLSPSAEVATTSHMMGENLLSTRVRDLRTVMAYLHNREDIDLKRMGLWGDSLAPPNLTENVLAVPLDATPYPARGEPLGGVAALLMALYEPHIQAIYVHGGLLSYATLLDEPFVYQPADSIIRGLLRIADLPDIAATLAPRPLWLEGLVDGYNRQVSREQVEETYHLARAAYAEVEGPNRLSIKRRKTSVDKISQWFLSCF